MSFIDNLLPASFRGIEFRVDNDTETFGRRQEINEVPFSDTPNTVDLGRKCSEFEVTAYVVGEDAVEIAATLVAAIKENSAPGLLTLPARIPLLVRPKDCKVRYDDHESNIIRLDLTFVEAGKNIFPSFGNNAKVQGDIQAAVAAGQVVQDFIDRYKTANQPSFVKSSASDKFNDFAEIITTVAQSGVSSPQGFSNFNKSAIEFKNNINENFTKPDVISAGTSSLISNLTSIYDSNNDAFAAQLSLLKFGNNYNPVNVFSTTSKVESDNKNAIVNLVQNVAITQLFTIASSMDFDSRQAAILILEQIGTAVESALIKLSNQNNGVQFAALSDAFATVSAGIKARSATLKNIVQIAIAASQPVAVFSYNLYGDNNSDQDITDRNDIIHPSFIPPMTSLEVLI